MTHQSYSGDGAVYTISPDMDLPAGRRIWGLILARALDEMTSEPLRSGLEVQTLQPELTPRVADGGLVGFAGVPFRAFPQLRSQAYSVAFTVKADGYIPLDLQANVAQTLNFPDSFTSANLGDVLLHRRPTVVMGRVALNSGILATPQAGARIMLTGLWRTPPPANLNVPPDPPNLVSLNPGLYFGRPATGGQLIPQTFSASPGPDKQLLQDAPAGRRLLRLSDRILVAANDVLAIDPGDPDRTEYMTIASISGASTANQPATITLTYPSRRMHRRGATVHGVTFQATGPATPLAQAAIGGDACLFLTTMVNLGTATLAAVQGGGSLVEYHSINQFTATTNTDGFYRLPPISRVARCKFKVHDGVHADFEVTFGPDYTGEECHLDFLYQ